MDDSSDNLNSSNSNLRDLIMQKLSAAREQKLKQNRSTSTISQSSKFSPPPPQIQSSGDEEKQLLLTLLEKSQASAIQSSQARKSLEAKISVLSDQVKKLTQDNLNLKQELDRYLKLNPNSKSEVLLLEEVKKLEILTNEREKKYKEEIKALNERIRNLLENQENTCKNEVIQMEEKVSNLFEVIKEKDREIERLKKNCIAPKVSTNEKILNQTLNELKKEKEKVERNLERSLQMSCEKEAELSDEVLKHRTLLDLAQKSASQKEKELNGQISSISQELASTKRNLQETLNKLVQERANFDSERNELKLAYKMLQKDIKSSEAFSTFYTLRGDLQRAQETIASLEATVKLKDTSISFLESQPRDKSPDLKVSLASIQKDFQEFYNYNKASEDLHSSEILAKNEEISGLLQEISELRHRILVFENKKYENELVLVRADLHKAVAERAHCKRLLVAYIRSVQHLEKTLKSQVEIEFDDIENVFNNEVQRLNEENKSLVEAKVKQEQFFGQEIKNLQEVIDALHEKIQDYEMKVDSVMKMRVKENTEEIKSWIIKNKQLQELNKRIVEGFSVLDQKNKEINSGRKKLLNSSLKIY